ncbi:MAG: hypothetical protein H7Y42_16745 [Chitinophagaceae bacterium]|nr:hypothetical protein [Chitinophagaceae bacterium]
MSVLVMLDAGYWMLDTGCFASLAMTIQVRPLICSMQLVTYKDELVEAGGLLHFLLTLYPTY